MADSTKLIFDSNILYSTMWFYKTDRLCCQWIRCFVESNIVYSVYIMNAMSFNTSHITYKKNGACHLATIAMVTIVSSHVVKTATHLKTATHMVNLDVICHRLTWKYGTTIMTSSNGNIFSRHWPYVRGIHRSPVNFPHKASEGTFIGCFLWSAPEQTVEQTIETSVPIDIVIMWL